MANYYAVVIKREPNGTFIASVPGVYASADTAAVAKREIGGAY